MEFLVWHMINCESEAEWQEDFRTIREAGFDGVVIWNVVPADGGWWDMSVIAHNSAKTVRALDALRQAGLYAYLGVWNPHCIGAVPLQHQVVDPNGKREDRPNLFDPVWIEQYWVPYIAKLASLFADHPAYRGLYFDDTFCWMENTYYSYNESDVLRYREYLKAKYGSYENYKQRHRLAKVPDSYEQVMPPESPAVDPLLWRDWMQARAEWCESFARITAETYRNIDGCKDHLLILGDNEFFYERSSFMFGVDFSSVMKYFDRLELYMAEDHRGVSDEDMAGNVRLNVKEGLRLAPDKGYGLLTWWTDAHEFKPMRMSMLRKMLFAGAESGAKSLSLYTFKVHDWRLKGEQRGRADNRSPMKDISLKYHPHVLQEIRTLVSDIRKQYERQ